MAATSGDDDKEPQLELPSLRLPRLGRRRARRQPPPETTTAEGAPEPVAPPAPAPEPERAPEPVAAATPTPEPALPAPEREPEPASDPVRVSEDAERTEDRGARRAGRAGPRVAVPSVSVPSLSGPVAAGVTGLVVGAGGTVGTYAAMAGCEAVRGVSSCGGGPGFFILVAIVVLMVLLGSLLLRLLGVSGGLSTSFLAVGLVTVLAMLLLIDVILSPWMFLVVPALSVAAYLLSHWVTTRFENEDVGRRDWR